MSETLMRLELLLPARIFAQEDAVARIVAETAGGSLGLLPHRLDCVAALVPGILTYTGAAGACYVAVDEGVLIKHGRHVLVSVRRAIRGADLRQLRAAVEREFRTLDARERSVRAQLAQLETGFLRRLMRLQQP